LVGWLADLGYRASTVVESTVAAVRMDLSL
jgi:hypothetical protein